MNDFVEDFKEICRQDPGINPPMSIDKSNCIDAGKTEFDSLETLHDRYRYVLVFVTKNLEADAYKKFITVMVVTFGLKMGNGKKDRVIPVLTKRKCEILCLDTITGFRYYSCKNSEVLRQNYKTCLTNTVKKARQEIP